MSIISTFALMATSVVLFCCGGGFGTMPSFNAGCFGTKYMGLNYALILTAWGFAALVGPILVARAKDMTGSFAGMLPLIALLLLGAVVLPFLTKKPTRRASLRISAWCANLGLRFGDANQQLTRAVLRKTQGLEAAGFGFAQFLLRPDLIHDIERGFGGRLQLSIALLERRQSLAPANEMRR